MSYRQIDTEEEFFEWMKEYVRKSGRKLNKDVNTTCDPPLIGYYDFIEGKVWPEGRVAYIKKDYSNNNGEPQYHDKFYINEEV